MRRSRLYTSDPSGSQKIIEALHERRDVGAAILASTEGVTCYRPDATFYWWPNITGAMNKMGFGDYETFRHTILRETGVSVATRDMFGDPL